MELPLDAEMLIPHRKPMRLIGRLNASDGKSGSASARFAADSPFVIDRKGMIERLVSGWDFECCILQRCVCKAGSAH
jgi:hypothetical protein